MARTLAWTVPGKPRSGAPDGTSDATGTSLIFSHLPHDCSATHMRYGQQMEVPGWSKPVVEGALLSAL